MAAAPFYKGSGQPPPTVPISYMGSGSGADAQSQVAGENPWSFSQSPLLIAVLAVIVGFVGLRYIHWG